MHIGSAIKATRLPTKRSGQQRSVQQNLMATDNVLDGVDRTKGKFVVTGSSPPSCAAVRSKIFATEKLQPSPLLQRLREFLPQISKANQELTEKIKTDEGRKAVNIEVLNDEASPYVEMNLALGILEEKKKKKKKPVKLPTEATPSASKRPRIKVITNSPPSKLVTTTSSTSECHEPQEQNEDLASNEEDAEESSSEQDENDDEEEDQEEHSEPSDDNEEASAHHFTLTEEQEENDSPEAPNALPPTPPIIQVLQSTTTETEAEAEAETTTTTTTPTTASSPTQPDRTPQTQKL
ncbi:hypothetical protein Pelo_12765 [Pelomyxa schiedti]|nr:hypothetical protein Pelo_12765 [Pelomyxa schiedti]